MKRFKELLLEMDQLPSFLTNKFGQYFDMNAKARERRAGNILYQDDQRYNDHEGALWLNVKKKDYHTIAAAVITGMSDTHRIRLDRIKVDKIVSSADELDNFIDNDPYVSKLVSKVWNFLKQYMSKGTVKVYRGLELTSALRDVVQNDPYIVYNPTRLLQYVDNTTKEFNSFSIDPEISINFAQHSRHNGQGYVLFSAEVDNNDVNWAFTAYLDGRHGGVGESELNVNNLKRLKNVKLVSYNIGFAYTKRLLKIVHAPIKNALETATNAVDAWRKLRHLTDKRVQFLRDPYDYLPVHELDNWRIFYISYNLENSRPSDEDSLNYDAYTYVIYNTKTDHIMCADGVRFFEHCLFVESGNGDSYELYIGDSSEPSARFKQYTRLIERNDGKLPEFIAVKLMNNKWAFFNVESNKFTTNETFDYILTSEEAGEEENWNLLQDNQLNIRANNAVYCMDKDKNIVAIYADIDGYTKPLSNTVMNSNYDVLKLCKINDKIVYFVKDLDKSQQANFNVERYKLVDENNNTLLKNVFEVFNTETDKSFATVAVNKFKQYHMYKLVDLNTMQFVSDVEFSDTYQSYKLEKLMDKFVLIERPADTRSGVENNILINKDGKYELGLQNWAPVMYVGPKKITFEYGDSKMTFDMTTYKLYSQDEE